MSTSFSGRKADFTSIYTRPDPRGYFAALAPLDYQIPQRALPTVERVLAASQHGDRPPTVLDVCCSYGINAALLRTDLTIDDLAARYAGPELAELPPAEVRRSSRTSYAGRLRHPERRVVGLDTSEPAIGYAVDTGLLADGWAEDLEVTDPSPGLAGGLADVGVVVCTGGVGYVGAPTFERLLAAHPRPNRLWVVSFVLRMFDYGTIAATLDGFGLRTEQVPDVSVRQRRFADPDEQRSAIDGVLARGLDPAGKEAEGWFHADCYVTRPVGESLPHVPADD